MKRLPTTQLTQPSPKKFKGKYTMALEEYTPLPTELITIILNFCQFEGQYCLGCMIMERCPHADDVPLQPKFCESMCQHPSRIEAMKWSKMKFPCAECSLKIPKHCDDNMIISLTDMHFVDRMSLLDPSSDKE